MLEINPVISNQYFKDYLFYRAACKKSVCKIQKRQANVNSVTGLHSECTECCPCHLYLDIDQVPRYSDYYHFIISRLELRKTGLI